VQKTKSYAFARFSADVLQIAIDKYAGSGEKLQHIVLVAENDGERWAYDSIEEFLAHCPRAPRTGIGMAFPRSAVVA
jgi:hypothetical protein